MDEERRPINNEVLLSPQVGDSNPLNRCVVLPVREDRQIEFQSGDVVGYYVDSNGDDKNDNDDGIQWIEGRPALIIRE